MIAAPIAPTYDEYLEYAERLGVQPFTRAEFDRTSPTHRALLGVAMQASPAPHKEGPR